MATNKLTRIQQLVAERRAKKPTKPQSYIDSPEFKKVKAEYLNFLETYKVSKTPESNSNAECE